MADERTIDINRRHPIWDKMYSKWEFYHDSYKGGEDYIKPVSEVNETTGQGSYLFPHDAEHLRAKKFLGRHKKSIYPNFCRLPINTYVKYIYSDKQPIQRIDTDGYEKYIDNIDMKQSSINTFMRRVAINMCIYGYVYVLVDKPPLPDYIVSLDHQQKEEKSRAYANLLLPQEVVDWSIDIITGEYNWVLIKSQYQNDACPFEDRETEDIYYLWLRNEFYALDDSGNVIVDEEGNQRYIEHNLGFVPIIRCDYSDVDEDDIPESMISDIAILNREIYNVYSLYQEELYKIAFAMLLKPKSKDQWTPEMELEEQLEFINSEVLMEYPEGSNPPSYLTPPVDALVEKRAYIDNLINKILQQSNLGNKDGVQPHNFQSGLAMSFAYNDMYNSVAQMAARLEQYEIKLWELVNVYDKGLVSGNIQVKYPTSFDVRTNDEKIRFFETVDDRISESPTLQAESAKDLYKSELRLEDKINEKIDKELEEGFSQENKDKKATEEANNLFQRGLSEATPEDITIKEETPPINQEEEAENA